MNKHLMDFIIGCFASLCAVFVPRMVAMLNDPSGNLQFFHANYVLVGIVFALTIGGITALLEQKNKKPPSETFMTALGIPALLAAALNTGTDTSTLHRLATEKQQVTDELQQKSGIEELQPANATKNRGEGISLVPLQAEPESHSRFDLQIIPNARAQTAAPPPKSGGFKLGIQLEQKPYVVVLGKSDDKAGALRKAENLRKVIPTATAVQSDQGFLVVDSISPSNKSDALLRAIDLQKRTGLKPYLLQVK